MNLVERVLPKQRGQGKILPYSEAGARIRCDTGFTGQACVAPFWYADSFDPDMEHQRVCLT